MERRARATLSAQRRLVLPLHRKLAANHRCLRDVAITRKPSLHRAHEWPLQKTGQGRASAASGQAAQNHQVCSSTARPSREPIVNNAFTLCFVGGGGLAANQSRKGCNLSGQLYELVVCLAGALLHHALVAYQCP